MTPKSPPRKKKSRRFKCGILPCIAAILYLARLSLLAGPPFMTDDPEPVDYRHWEFYFFGQGDHTPGGFNINGPAVELNYGVLPDTQLHLVAPAITTSADGASTAGGLGDTELGIKYRFVHETDRLPQIGIFPMAELPTGDADRGLGNGRTWFRLPLWVQKSRGPWTTYGGGGAALNSAPGRRNYPFGGWLLQRDFGRRLTLGAEIFAQGADTDADHGFATLNAGGYYNVTQHFSVLFSAGHTVAGDTHTFWYFGLYWTWGPEKSFRER
ncbi:MAG: hypothetical protein KGJ88_08870 [Verrucomicrobiota bacterium]|nr:hypothetical protein [Verrucomicrobiota bacterium]